MFCMACGAEIAGHLTVCPNCGQPVRGSAPAGSAEQATRAATTPPTTRIGEGAAALAAPAPASVPAVGVPTAPVGPSISDGDISNTLVPRDTVGRVVMATTLAMAVDVLAPWVTLGQTHLPLVRLGAPVLLLLVALALALAALRPSLRRQPTWAALPLTLGAVCLGAGVGMWAVLAWLSPRLTFISTSVSAPALGQSTPSTLTFSPDLGLYLFLAASALLVFSGYQFFLASRDARLREAYVVRSPREIPFPYTLYALQPPASAAGMDTGMDSGVAPPLNNQSAIPPGVPLTEPSQAEASPPPASADPAPPAANPAPILPGTAAWSQPQEAPSVMRHPTPGAGFSRTLGPRGGR